MEAINNQHECCPLVDTSVWDHKTHEWKDNLFIKASIPLFFHIPSLKKVEKVIMKLWEQAKEAGINKDEKDYYFYYTTCPKCAKKYGHNYIIAFVEI